MRFALACLAMAIVSGSMAAAPAGTPGVPEEIVIGLIVPQQAGDIAGAGRDALCGSETAVKRARAWSGEAGHPARSIRLVTAASGHPWDDPAPAVARLIHEQGASIIIGGLDAATAHAAEQVVLRERGRALFLSIWASEDALTQLPVPWYFSVVPDDRRQAHILAQEIFETRGARGAAIVADGSRDGRSAAAAFEAAAPAGSVLRLAAEDEGAVARIAAAARARGIQAVVLAAGPAASARAAREIARQVPGLPILGVLRLATPAFGRRGEKPGASVSVLWPSAPDPEAFVAVRDACAAPGDEPGPIARYAYDAATAAIAALSRANGATMRPLEQRLATVSFTGASGPVRFDPASRGSGATPGLVPVALSSDAAGAPAR